MKELTKEEICEGNLLIKDFYLEVVSKGNRITDLYTYILVHGIHDKYLFNEDWIYLMAVVDEIELLKDNSLFEDSLYVKIYKNKCTIIDSNDELICEIKADTRKNATWQNLVKFIQWYNQNKKN